MSAVCGLYNAQGGPVDGTDLTRMLDALAHWDPDARGSWLGGGVALGYLHLRTGRQGEAPALPLHDPQADLAITGDVRLDNRAELAARLDAHEIGAVSDAHLVLRAYREWGEQCAAQFTGDFAFALWDGPQRRLFCARDAFGVRPFYYHARGDTLAFASEIKGLLALPAVDRAVNDTWIGDYLHRLSIERTETFYRDIKRLEPAHALVRGPEGMRIWQDRRPDPHAELTLANDAEYIEAFREKLVLAIRRRVDATAATGAECSGGLDSSAICAIAHRLLSDSGRVLFTFSQVLPEQHDEAEGLPGDARWAVDQLCAHAGITETCLLSGDGGVLGTLDWAERVLDEPPRNVVSLYNDDLYEAAAASGVRVLLSGFGGNQAVSSVASDRRHELLLSGRWLELWREVWAARHQWHPAIALASVLWNATDHHGLDAAMKRSRFWARQPKRATRDAVARHLGLRERALKNARDGSVKGTLRGQAIARLDLPMVAQRLEFAHAAVTARRIEYPLLDADLIAFYLAVPSRLKHWRGMGRYLFRLAIEGWVPDAIRWESGPRASANPGIVRRRQRQREQLMARLRTVPDDSPLFRYVDPAKLPGTLAGRGVSPRRDTELLMLLILEHKLRNLAP